MVSFKTSLITCQQCGRKIMVRSGDAERGFITCSHVGCGAINQLKTAFYYDESIVQGLPGFGQLTYLGSPQISYPLQYGSNVIGTSDSCTVRVNRFLHNHQCFISRRHCTLMVTFDRWTGKFRYQIQDGAIDNMSQTMQFSLNGTQVNDVLMLKNEMIDVSDNEIITLGRLDRFRLSHYLVPNAMLNTYKVELDFNPDRTQ